MTEISSTDAAQILWASSEEGKAAVKAGWEAADRLGLYNINGAVPEAAEVSAICWAAHLAAQAAAPAAATFPSVHDCEFQVIAVQPGQQLGRPVTVVLMRCAFCSRPSTGSLEGTWTLAQLLTRIAPKP